MTEWETVGVDAQPLNTVTQPAKGRKMTIKERIAALLAPLVIVLLVVIVVGLGAFGVYQLTSDGALLPTPTPTPYPVPALCPGDQIHQYKVFVEFQDDWKTILLTPVVDRESQGGVIATSDTMTLTLSVPDLEPGRYYVAFYLDNIDDPANEHYVTIDRRIDVRDDCADNTD